MQPNEENPQKIRNKQIVFATVSILAIAIVGTIAYFALSKIRSGQTTEAMTQEQFEGAPTISSQLQSDCQQSAIKIAEMTNGDKMSAEFHANVENCKDVYFMIDHQTQFRREGMYPDLAVDIAYYIAKSDKPKGLELLNFARGLKPWEFYLGPVTCDSQHVLDAYIESYTLPEQSLCIKKSEYKTTLLKDLQSKNFDVFTKMLANNKVVWMGLPDSDVGCPEKLSTVIQTVKRLSTGTIEIEEPAMGSNDANQINFVIKSAGQDKITLIFTAEKECLQLSSILVPELEVSE
ncbi:MAG: hypothetical protein H7061_10680 [Bdellovibrionaceae bacterium]|nr:hypothetical protein [Bdellovibrio sp.]